MSFCPPQGRALRLDAPTEGLDDPDAQVVLPGIWHFLPVAASPVAAQRQAETACADRIILLRQVA